MLANSNSVHVELFRVQDVGYKELCDVLENASGRKCLQLVLGSAFRIAWGVVGILCTTVKIK